MDFIFSEVQRFAFYQPVFICGNGIYYLTCRITEGAVQRNHIFGGGDFIDRTGQALHLIYRLINAVAFGHCGKYLAGFADLDDPFLCHVGFGYFHYCHRAFLCCVVSGHIKVNRVSVQYIAIRCGYFHKGIPGTVFQLFRRHKIPLVIGVEGINRGRCRVGEGHFHLATVRTVKLEACARIRNGLACLCIYLDDFDIALKVCIVGKVAVNLPVLCNIHIEVGKQLTALPAGYLMDSVDTIRQLFGLCKAVFIANKIITLAVFGGVIAAGGFQINGELRTGFRSFQLGFAIVCVFDESDTALDDLLIHIIGGGVVFHGIKLGFRTYMVGGFVQQIALGWADLADAPVIITNIICCDKLTIGIGGVSVDELVALVNAINSTGKGGVTLRRAGFPVTLSHGGAPLFQNIGHALFADGIPFHRCHLAVGNHIADRRVHFLQHIAGADQHIFEIRLAATVGHSILIYGNPGKRGAIQVELHTLHQTVLTGLGHGQVAALQHIIEGHSCGSASDDRHALNSLRLILIIALFGHGINAGSQTINQEFTSRIGRDRLIDPVSGYREGDTLHLAVFRCLFQSNRSGRRFHIQIGAHTIRIFNASDQILQVGITISNQLGTLADNRNVISGRRDAYRTFERVGGTDRQRIPGLGNAHIPV